MIEWLSMHRQCHLFDAEALSPRVHISPASSSRRHVSLVAAIETSEVHHVTVISHVFPRDPLDTSLQLWIVCINGLKYTVY